MATKNPMYAAAAKAAARFTETNDMRALITALKEFDASRIGGIAEQDLPAFIARIWTGPRIWRVK